MSARRLRGAALALLLFLAACAPTGRPEAGSSTAAQPSAPAGPHGLLRIAWGPEPPTLSPKMSTPSSSAFNEAAITFNSSLSYVDTDGVFHPMLAQELPSVERGDWVVNSDGTMVTTYKLRPNAKWHDGAPITAHDFAFSFAVYIDPAVAVARRIPENLMSKVDDPDPTTLVITWKQAYYGAGSLRYQQLDPLPSHIFEERYAADKASFTTGSEWTTDFVGSGPFRVVRWDPGVGITAQAFSDWVLGPPKVAMLDIRFMNDPNTILAGLLSGDVDVSGGPWITPALAASARDRWVEGELGTMQATQSRMQHMDFQYRDVPNGQPALREPKVRQALITALDRQGLVDLLTAGFGGQVADAFMLRTDPAYADVEPALTKYPYDPSRASALLADAGWTRNASGQAVNAAGVVLKVEPWLNTNADSEKESNVISNNWQAIGIDAPIFLISAARASDAEFVASFPGTIDINRPVTPDNFIWLSTNAPSPQNRWQGSNRGSLIDAEVDRLQNAVLAALTPADVRAGQVALWSYITRDLLFAPLYYPADMMLSAKNVTGPYGHATYPANSWNIWEWSIATPAQG